ncbi:hypothetical protein AGMMS49936_09370 [Endomicrobiia bacterium]|nr:hypothetical protein AGMMS49936_09370 [Endomicrobiia bacterium]
MAAKSINNTELQIAYCINEEMYISRHTPIIENAPKQDNSKKTWQKLNPNFKNQLQLEEFLKKTKDINIESLECKDVVEMTPRYNPESVASSVSIGNEYFTYSTDKRKSAIIM